MNNNLRVNYDKFCNKSSLDDIEELGLKKSNFY